MKISILIPTYGSQEWQDLAIRKAYRSAEHQGAHEVIASHDQDGTVATFRNSAAAHATGDYLVFLDGDDELAPGYVEAMREAHMRSRILDPLLTPAVSQIRNGYAERSFFYPEIPLQTGNWLVIGTAVPKALFDQIGGFRDFPHGLEDWNFWSRCVRAGAQIVKVPDAIYRAHWNANSDHHRLAKNPKAYFAAYNAAKEDAWG